MTKQDKPNLVVAITNFKNFFRQMIGLPKAFPVKVMRTPEAKKYQLMEISKAGDVGYNLPSTAEVTIPAISQYVKERHNHLIRRAEIAKVSDNLPMAQRYEQEAWDLLPKAMIPTGISLEMPNNIWCTIEARSSSSKKLLITPDAIIDAGYRGELFAVVYNFGYTDYKVQLGEQLVQVIFHERAVANIKEVDKLGESQRGSTGFGSTGSIAEGEKR
jgi:dUTP pyrophosphatase